MLKCLPLDTHRYPSLDSTGAYFSAKLPSFFHLSPNLAQICLSFWLGSYNILPEEEKYQWQSGSCCINEFRSTLQQWRNIKAQFPSSPIRMPLMRHQRSSCRDSVGQMTQITKTMTNPFADSACKYD